MMASIRETILKYPGIEEGDSFLDVVLDDRSLDGAADYIASKDKATVRLAVADVYAMIGGLPDFTENKLSITYPRSWYTQKAKELYEENGEPEKANKLGRKVEVPRGRVLNRW